MTIVLDERVRAAISRRRARGKDTGLVLLVTRPSPKTSIPNDAAVGWVSRCRSTRELVTCHVGGIEVYVDRRVARYAKWRDVVVSAWRLGPVERLVLADPFLMLHIAEWECARARSASAVVRWPVEELATDSTSCVPASTHTRHSRREAGDR